MIAFKLVLPVVSNHMSDCNFHTNRPSVCWGKANCYQIARFKASVRDKIELCFTNVAIDIFSCTGCVDTQPKLHQQLYTHFVDQKHAISCIAIEFQDILVTASVTCILHVWPSSSSLHDNSRQLSGWNEKCASLKGSSLCGHSIWVNIGCPNVGIVADLMRSALKKYYFPVKSLLRSQTDLHNSALANVCVNKPPNLFWRKLNVPMHALAVVGWLMS